MTSTLQQEGGRKLRMSSSQVMRVAQGLYERGYITYMRTDNVVLSDEAMQATRAAVTSQYGQQYLSPSPKQYSSKVKNAQEAHEAIRPTTPYRTPPQVSGELNSQDLAEETLKSTCALLLALLSFVSVSQAQNAPARTDLYHVHFAKAALGKGAELGEFLKTADPNVPMSAHHIVLRHQDGEDWDYAVIQHLGTKTTVEAAGTAVTPGGARPVRLAHRYFCERSVLG